MFSCFKCVEEYFAKEVLVVEEVVKEVVHIVLEIEEVVEDVIHIVEEVKSHV